MEAILALVLALAFPQDTLAGRYSEYRELCREVGAEYDIDPYVLCGIAGYETEFDNSATNPRTTVCCAMQIMPGHEDRPPCSKLLRSKRLCMETAATYITRLRKRFGDDIETILCHYNCGNTCYKGSMKSYVPGVLWTMDILRRFDDVDPYGYYACSVELPMQKVTGEDTTLSAVGMIPVYAGDGRWSGRDTIRHYRSRLEKKLRDGLRYRTCAASLPELYDPCIHAPGRSSVCAFIPIPRHARTLISVMKLLTGNKST